MDLDQLLDMKNEELVTLFHARARRRYVPPPNGKLPQWLGFEVIYRAVCLKKSSPDAREEITRIVVVSKEVVVIEGMDVYICYL